jgi:hypothetical protein
MKIKRNALEFTDFLFILLLTFLSLFILTLLLINPVAKKAEIVQKAEYLIILEWNKSSRSDIDLWVESPDQKVVSFRSKQMGIMHLDMDDMGGLTDSFVTKDGNVSLVQINQEVVTLRGKQQGEYIVNLHLYRLSEPDNLDPIKVSVIRLNPFQTIWAQEVILTTMGEETTVLRFSILNNEGDVGEINNLPKKFVNALKGDNNYNAFGNPSTSNPYGKTK